MAEILRGKPVANALCEELAERVAKCVGKGISPTLAIIRVGSREDDVAYERGAMKRCHALGIDVRGFELSADCSQSQLMDVIFQVNNDASIHGCLLFLPLPDHLDESAAAAGLDEAKDVDGITQGSSYGVFANREVGFPPCTADACMQILRHYGYKLEGAEVAVVGRSMVVGKPVSMMLQAANATVTMCHTKTRNLSERLRMADVLVVAAGHMGTVGANEVCEGQVIIDVGINWDENAKKICGDVLYDEVESKVDAITPVPRGVGSVTTAILAKHVIEAAERSIVSPSTE